ncbi:MAG: hydrogenase formation protein HypD [Dysgonamonadaceae bacterium]|jgi:hydrogenase expression/formation protein HypD|nr:hydrogenase formation protein HypD [Dysgonamonadaceae bacterium]
MQYVDDYRNSDRIRILVQAIRKEAVHPWQIMEICGGQTHTIARYRIEEMLPPTLGILHGPGCPVCVTPESIIDHALEIAARPEVIFTSFGDMMRVPGSHTDLLHLKACGADVRMLYSPLDALVLAENHPEKEVVFFAIGFETTAPVHLMALKEAERKGLKNFSLLCSLFAVPPAIEMILSQPDHKIDGFLIAGHVCAITGNEAYHAPATRYRRPMIVTGFEPVDILYGIYKCIRQLERKEARVENAYKRAVAENGNPEARQLMEEALEPVGREWRGIGLIPASGFALREIFSAYNAEKKFPYKGQTKTHASAVKGEKHCIAGEIMKGNKQVSDCRYFATACNPQQPFGAPMVSAEGVCAAYYHYQ